MIHLLLIAISAKSPQETLLVHGGPMIPTRIARACMLAPDMSHIVLAGNEAEMHTMATELHRQCPEVLPKTQMLPFYVNNTADHVVCTMRLLPYATTLTQLAFDYHMPRLQRTSALLKHHALQMQWLYVSLPNPSNVAWRILDEKDRYLPQVDADVHAALSGPCALDRC